MECIFCTMSHYDYRTLEKLANLGYVEHPRFPGVVTLPAFAHTLRPSLKVTAGKLNLHIGSADYLRIPAAGGNSHRAIRFQQDCYRLWYQIGGNGILQNATRKSFGTARPGLLGIMEPGERHTYLHQRDTFEGFLLDFSLDASAQTLCYWNAEIEGKKTLDEKLRVPFENLVFEALQLLSLPSHGLDIQIRICARLTDIVAELFSQGLLLFTDEQFPKDKPKKLVEMARRYMRTHYATLQHQNDLERECGVDINYLNTLFKKQTSQTLYAFLSDVRLEHARHLLEDERVSITDIATRVGYPNSNSFTRLFRKKTGTSPSEYRAKHSATAKTE